MVDGHALVGTLESPPAGSSCAKGDSSDGSSSTSGDAGSRSASAARDVSSRAPGGGGNTGK
jgi:hypothetical protein